MLGGFGALADWVGGEPRGGEDLGQDAAIHVGWDGEAEQVENGRGEVHQAGGVPGGGHRCPRVGVDARAACEKDAVGSVSAFGKRVCARVIRLVPVMVGVFDDQIRAVFRKGAEIEVFAAVGVGDDGKAVDRVPVRFQKFGQVGEEGVFFGGGYFALGEASGVVDPQAQAKTVENDFGVGRGDLLVREDARLFGGLFDGAEAFRAQAFDPFAQERKAHVRIRGEAHELAFERAARPDGLMVAALHEALLHVLAGAHTAKAVIG